MKNIYKRISAMIIAIAMTIMLLPLSESAMVSASPTFWDETTISVTPAGDVYSISNGAELAWIAQQVNGGNNFSGKTIELTDNIVLNSVTIDASSADAKAWTAIGSQSNPFSGTFDGQGHTVSGIYINSSDGYQGLFGYSSGTIKNVGVINSYIKGAGNTGGVVGENDGGTVTNCYNEGTIIGTNSSTGGVVG